MKEKTAQSCMKIGYSVRAAIEKILKFIWKWTIILISDIFNGIFIVLLAFITKRKD